MSDARADVVATIKAELEARGVSLVGPCGAFQITKRVAWTQRATGAGLLFKNWGNNCENFAVDIVAFPDGRVFDVLVSAGGEEDANKQPIPGTGNGPVWNPSGNGVMDDLTRYRPAIDPGDPPPAPLLPRLPPPPGDAATAPLLESHARLLDVLEETTAQLTELNARLKQLQAEGIRVRL